MQILKDEQGAVAILFALCLTMLVGFSAVALDVGQIALQKQSLQKTLDAAVLAAAADLPNTATATATAKQYVVKNGYQEEDIASIQFLNADKEIRMTAAKAVAYSFARIFNSGSSTNVNVTAAAAKTSPFGPYEYALFSGSQVDLLQFTGQNTIVGDVHSNNSIKNSATVYGTVTAVGTIDSKITATEGKITKASVMPMPDFTDVVKLATIIDGNTLTTSYGATYKNGVYSMSAEQINHLMLDYPVTYIQANVEINGSGVNIDGTMIVDGDITFNGSNVSMGADASICLCSLTGNITFDGGQGNFQGILCAPNGTISLNGSGGTVYGSVYADLVNSNGGVKIEYNEDAYDAVPDVYIRLVE